MSGQGEHVVALLPAYLDGTLAPGDIGRVEQHLAECSYCQAALDARRTVAPAAPARLAAGVSAGDWFFRIFWGTVGLASLTLLALTYHVNNLQPTPLDLRVLGQTEWLAGSDAALHLRVLRHGSEGGVPGVPVVVEIDGPTPGRSVRLADVTTGPDGSAHARFHLPEWPDGKYPLKVAARLSGAPESVTQQVGLRRSWRLMLSTDKPVYQPGQTIKTRALALRRPDLKPVAGQEQAFSVTDPKGNVIFRSKGVSSRFGIGSAECPLADDLIEGPYRVECRVGNMSSAATVEVKTYVLPKFKVIVDLDRPYYQPGEVVKGKVRADYVFGKPVVGGLVKLGVATVGSIPQRFERVVDLTTRGDGVAEFTFALPERLFGGPAELGDVRVAITATVRDPAGQTQSRAVTVAVARSPIRVDVVPEAGILVRGLPNTIHVLTSYPDGRPVAARLSISGVDHEVKTDARGVGSFEVTPEGDRVAFTVEATDAAGLVGRRVLAIECGKAGDDFLVRTDRAVYRGGETLTLTALGAGNEPVFVDLLRDGQTVLSESVPVAQGRGALQVDLPADLSGTVVLCAYRYNPEGFPVRKSRVLYIRPANELQVRTAWDRPEYTPGGHAKLSVSLTDGQGQPAPGAVSLAAVDEAVFALLEQKPGLEKTFFTLDQELLRPVYEIHEWTPDDPSADRGYESALFARTARVVDEKGDQSGRGTLHTLALSSYPQKLEKVGVEQGEASERLRVACAVLVGVGGVLGLIWCLIHVRPLGEVLVCLLILGVLIALLLPAVQSAREASRRAMEESKDMMAPAASALPAGGEEPVRVRQFFPETLLWRPEIVTDDQGRAGLELDLADSITTWRLTASAITADGRLGASQSPLRVFQPFFVDLDLPPALTRGDEVAVPVVVSNYLDKPLSVALTLREAPWFERLDEGPKTLELKPGEVRAAHFRVRVHDVGRQELEVTAKGGGAADAVRRPIEVVPDGRRVEQAWSGTLRPEANYRLETPEGAIPGSVSALVKLYPSSFSQLVEGLDAIFQQPFGCFEQASSTTYPNVLALDYLKRMGKAVPAVEVKARQYIHLGYQRLLTFEIPGGGFDWFGNPPANRVLTAYGLMEFEDMARVHDVEPSLIERTRSWLLSRQNADGTWDPEGHRLQEDPTAGSGDDPLARLSTTAYVGWAVFAGQPDDPRAWATRGYLADRRPESIDDPYTLALVANALLAIDPDSGVARPFVDRLSELKKTELGHLVWWESAPSRRTMFHGAGRSGSIETTATAALALIADGRDPALVRDALGWLVAHKDARGTWGSTQATVLALKALLAGTGKPLGGGQPRRFSVSLDGKKVRDLVIPADQADVVQQVDLSGQVARGSHRLQLVDGSASDSRFQVVYRYHVPDDPKAPESKGPLTIRLDYDRTTLAVDEFVTAKATVENRGPSVAPMVILDLPIPGGFSVEADDLAGLVAKGLLARYQVTPRSAIVYLRSLEPGKPLVLTYRLRATMPVKLAVPPARAYEYYDPERSGSSAAASLTVMPGGRER